MKYPPYVVGLLQALGVTAYIGLFATAVNTFETLGIIPEHTSPLFAITFFLLMFVTSALITSSTVFGYPIFLFLHDKKREAVRTIIWTAMWLIVSAASVFLIIATR